MKYVLFCPGPVNVAENVKQVVLDYEIGHREVEFSDLLKSVDRNLLRLVGVKHVSQFRSVLITGSSSAANETVISTVLGNKRRMLVVMNGEFGNRLFELASHHSRSCYRLDFGWAKPINLETIEEKIKKNNIDTLVMVHHETSTGMLNPIDKVADLVKKYKLLFIVDAVSSVGAERIDMEKWHIDFLIGATGKAVGAFPGSSFIVGKKSEYQKLKHVKHDTYYLNLWRYYEFMESKFQTPNTPAVQSFLALDQALKNTISTGLNKHRQLLLEKAQKIRTFFKAAGLRFVIPEKDMSVVLTTVNIPQGITVCNIMEKLRKKNIIIYSGKGPLANRAFQVATIGSLQSKDIDYFINSFKEILYGEGSAS